jgi:hypothetical protein
VTFDWVISPNRTSPGSNYSVASSDDPFAITIPATPLTLTDPGTEDEAYTFSLNLPKAVVPSSSITSNGDAAVCWFNSTVFSAKLYTQRPNAINSTNSPPSPGDGGDATDHAPFAPWPYAVEVSQVVAGGQDVPACYVTENGVQGAQVGGFTAQASSDTCECLYQNYDL